MSENKHKRPQCAALNTTGTTGMCVALDWLDATTTLGNDMFVATYIEELLEVGGPEFQRVGEMAESKPWELHKEQTFYVAPPENWDLVLEHRIKTQDGVLEGQDLFGFFRNVQRPYTLPLEHVRTGVPDESESKAFRKREKATDNRLRLNLGELLEKAGISSLDDQCRHCNLYNVTGEAARIRRIGLELEITFFYSNLWWDRSIPNWFHNVALWSKLAPYVETLLSWVMTSWHLKHRSEVKFEVQVSATQPVEGVRLIQNYNDEQSALISDLPVGKRYRIKRRSHGIRIRFRQRGVIGKFSFASVLSYIGEFMVLAGVGWKLSEAFIDLAPNAMQCCRRLRVGNLHSEPEWYSHLMSRSVERVHAD